MDVLSEWNWEVVGNKTDWGFGKLSVLCRASVARHDRDREGKLFSWSFDQWIPFTSDRDAGEESI